MTNFDQIPRFDTSTISVLQVAVCVVCVYVTMCVTVCDIVRVAVRVAVLLHFFSHAGDLIEYVPTAVGRQIYAIPTPTSPSVAAASAKSCVGFDAVSGVDSRFLILARIVSGGFDSFAASSAGLSQSWSEGDSRGCNDVAEDWRKEPRYLLALRLPRPPTAGDSKESRYLSVLTQRLTPPPT